MLQLINITSLQMSSNAKMKPASDNIMLFVRSFTFGFVVYVITLLAFFMLNKQHVDEDPRNWWLPAILFYTCLNSMLNVSLRYMHLTLAKKIAKADSNDAPASTATASYKASGTTSSGTVSGTGASSRTSMRRSSSSVNSKKSKSSSGLFSRIFGYE